VDDLEINRSILTDILSPEYEILEAENGLAALNLLQKRHGDISLILLDLIMPEMDGFGVLEAMNRAGWLRDIPVITISAESAPRIVDRAYDLGAVDYISRPFDERTIRRRVMNTIMLYNKQKTLEGIVTEQVMEKEKDNLVMVEILSNIVEFRNGESGLHVIHIRVLTEIFLRKLMEITDRYPLLPAQMTDLINASALHDIGKISIPGVILNKPGKLTAGELEVMKTHCAIGAQILESTPYHNDNELVKAARDICRWHHERWDGSGYPDGLKGDEIPLGAQVVALADVYDALISERVYKPAYSHEEAMGMILGGKCGAFNPVLLECLMDVGPRLQRELEMRSDDSLAGVQTQQMAAWLIAGGRASTRTLAMLEQERIKYQFFASMSNEIQFEIDYQADLLTISEWGAKRLDLSPVLVHPKECAELFHVIAQDDFREICGQLHQTSRINPTVGGTYRLRVDGEWRWHKTMARAMWADDESEETTGAIGKFIDIHEDYLRMERLTQMAEQDALTGLSNQRAVKQAVERMLKENEPRAMMLFFDLDDFKRSNDQYGHMFGDEVLRHVAGRIHDAVREGDIAARMGGDEFLLFMPYKGDPGPLARRVMGSVTGDFRGYRVSISVGVALAPENGRSFEELLVSADRALYTAKARGKNQLCFYEKDMASALSVISPKDH